MKHLIKTILFVSTLATLSFTKYPENHLAGTYGVSKEDLSQIRLTLNEDHSFTYQDFSNSSKRIAVEGNWELKGKFVVLENTDSKYSFHRKWKISKNGMIAKSRKGMTFYRLCKCDG